MDTVNKLMSKIGSNPGRILFVSNIVFSVLLLLFLFIVIFVPRSDIHFYEIRYNVQGIQIFFNDAPNPLSRAASCHATRFRYVHVSTQARTMPSHTASLPFFL